MRPEPRRRKNLVKKQALLSQLSLLRSLHQARAQSEEVLKDNPLLKWQEKPNPNWA